MQITDCLLLVSSSGAGLAYSEAFQSIIQGHTYARSPLRAYGDPDPDDPARSPFNASQGQYTFFVFESDIILLKCAIVSCKFVILFICHPPS